MSTPITQVVEHLFFSPYFFLILFLFAWIQTYRKQPGARGRTSKWMLGIWLALMVCSNTLFYRIVAYPLKQLTPVSRKHKADAIVVASSGVHESGAPSLGSTRRAHAAAELYLEKLAPVIIVTGGVTVPYRPPSHIKGIPIILEGMGVGSEQIIVENRATDTFMNGIETLKILKKHGMSSVLLVSHDYHLYRLTSVFRKLGIQVYPYAANLTDANNKTPWWQWFDWENFNRLQTITHEYIGIITYKLSGWI